MMMMKNVKMCYFGGWRSPTKR